MEQFMSLSDYVRKFLIIANLLVSFFIFSKSLQAADIIVSPKPVDGISIVTIFGPINFGDDQKFASLITPLQKALVVLDSPGGSTIAAIEIGKAIRLKELATTVPDKALCASACALIWLAGHPRFLSKESSLGFHASYVEKDGQLLESGVANALIGRYLTLLNLPESAVIFITNAPPKGMNWLTENTKRVSSIEYQDIEIFPKIETTKQSPTAEQTVTRFYQSLAIADGIGAAALVVPEKRGIGPFNEVNISEFFGGLLNPLKVLSQIQKEPNVFLVEYEFTRKDNSYCHTVATVTTGYHFNQYFIEKISAKC
jgi:hypothetical protein